MTVDYRELEDRSQKLRHEIERITSQDSTTAEDRDKVMRMIGENNVLAETAGALRDAELDELRSAAVRPVAETAETDPQVDDFRHYMHTGEQRASLLAGTAGNGGVLVPEPLHGPLIEKIRKNDPVLAAATFFPMATNTMYLPYKATHGAVANAAEAGARSEQNAPTFTEQTLTAFEYYTDQRATQLYLNSVDGAEAQILDWVYEDIMEQAAADAVAGAGSTTSLGLFGNTSSGYATELSGAAGAIANTAFLKLYFKIAPKYRANGAWLMSGATLATAGGLAFPGLNDTPLVRFEGGVPTIMGKPVLETDSAPAIGATNFPVAFGDIGKGYAFGALANTTILVDPYTATPKVRYYGLGMMGGTPWDNQAIALMKSNNS